ncbi:MAG: hypothetical protein HGA90_05755 [Alphaproteobacteria bacterium]|nr:hypothetical protein [Alphaproteobacteria bacterium]
MRKVSSFTKTHRALALIVGAVLALSMILGAAFVLADLHHHCTGEHCQICAAVAHTVAFLKAETASLTMPAVFAIWLFMAFLASSDPKQTFDSKPSPVSLKVKLSD